MEVEAVVTLQGSGVFLAQKGYLDHVSAAGLPPLKGLVSTFIKENGRIFVCTLFIRERKIEESDLIEGAKVGVAVALTQEILSANATLVY